VYEPTVIAAAPAPRRGRTALIVVAVVAAVCCGLGGVASALRYATQNDGGSSVSPTPPGFGVAVRDGVFEFTVQSMTCGQTELVNGWLRATPQGQFCVGQLTVSNIGSTPQRFADGNQKAFGPDGKAYAADTGAGVVANGNGDAIWNVVNPGNSLAAKVVFDTPPGATIVWLEVHDSAFSRGVRVWVGG